MSFFFRLPNLIFGRNSADNITGTERVDYVFALGGNDVIDTRGGDDVVLAGRGDDVITGGAGSDLIDGGSGFDTAVYSGAVEDYSFDAISRFSGFHFAITDSDGETDNLYRVEAVTFQGSGLTLYLDGRNNAVYAMDDAVTSDENGAVFDADDLLANDRDFDGDDISVESVSSTSSAGASLNLSGGMITYDPGSLFDYLGDGETATDSFTYVVSDGHGGDSTATVNVTVQGANDAAVITSSDSAAIDENTIDVLTVTATDPDQNDTISYSIEGGDDAALFQIDSQTGALSFITAPDYENPGDAGADNVYDVMVGASDGTGTTTQSIAVTVNDVDEAPAITPRINEFHYDNAGADEGEFIEIRVAAGDDVSAMTLELYNGNGGVVYDSFAVSGGVMTSDGAYDYYVLNLPPNGIQNGPDGLALSVGGSLIEFLSYEGSFAGAGGTADGVTSTDIGVEEGGGTLVGDSLQRRADGTWEAPRANTSGADNDAAPAANARLNEFHYDNDGADVGEFVEVRVDAGADVSDLSVELYNGNNGAPYGSTLQLASASMTSDGAYDYYVFNLPANGLQNGSPDGLALIQAGSVVEFLSYEGAFMAVGGTADGQMSSDINAEEPGDAPIGSSLQRSDDGSVWTYTPGENTSGSENLIPLNIKARINEFHYDNEGSDTGEFVEVRVNAGAGVGGLLLELYNGNGGAVYNSVDVSTLSSSSDGTWDYYVWQLPSNGIQNGSPDGLALSNNGSLIEFLSYEGAFAGSGGAAAGVMSTDIDVEEPTTTPVGFSLQRLQGDDWDAPREYAGRGERGARRPPERVPLRQCRHGRRRIRRGAGQFRRVGVGAAT